MDAGAHGNGIFVACLKPMTDVVGACEDAAADELLYEDDFTDAAAASVAETLKGKKKSKGKKKRRPSDNDQDNDGSKKKKRNRRRRRPSTYWKPTLASRLRSTRTGSLDEMLAAQGGGGDDQQPSTINIKKWQRSSLPSVKQQQQQSRSSSLTTTGGLGSMVSLEVFGTGLKRFFAAMQRQQLQQLRQQKKEDTNATVVNATAVTAGRPVSDAAPSSMKRHWVYPVPNPSKWR